MSENIQIASMPLEDYKSACDTIREITNSSEVITSGELAKKVEEVYDYDWNKLKHSVSGEIIGMHGVSPIEHEMGVKVSGVDDLTSVKVLKLGKNLCDNVFELGEISSTDGTEYESGGTIRSVNFIPVIPNTKYAIKAFTTVEGVRFRFYDEYKNYIGYIFGVNTPSFQTKDNCHYLRFSVVGTQGNLDTKLQLELGDVSTEYEPYIEPTEYTPDADGTVHDVTSIYPTTTLITNTDGVIIDAIYNKEISEVDEVPERIEAVYDEGCIKGEREMWDYILNYGTKNDLHKAFYATGFEYIHPPYKITPTYYYSLSQTFNDSEKLKKIESAYFDFSKKQRGTFSQGSLYWTFAACSELEEIEDIGLQPDYSLSSTFVWCGKLRKIAMVRVDENTLYDDPFIGCGNLEDIRFEGVIGQNGLNFSTCKKLSKASWINIIGCLSTTTSGLSITGSLDSIKKAFETSPGSNDGDTSTEWLELETSRSNWKINLL